MEDFAYITALISQFGYAVVGLMILIECIGVPLPGETALILASVAASFGHLNIGGVIFIAIVGAVIGDNFGYMVGRHFGRRIIKRFEHWPIFHFKHIERVEIYFKKHGNKTVFLGRFTPLLRIYAALFAGIFHMDYRKFLFYNLAGGVCWATSVGLLSFYLGNNLPLIWSLVQSFNIFAISVLVLLIVFFVGKFLWEKRQEKALDALVEEEKGRGDKDQDILQK